MPGTRYAASILGKSPNPGLLNHSPGKAGLYKITIQTFYASSVLFKCLSCLNKLLYIHKNYKKVYFNFIRYVLYTGPVYVYLQRMALKLIKWEHLFTAMRSST